MLCEQTRSANVRDDQRFGVSDNKAGSDRFDPNVRYGTEMFGTGRRIQ